MTIYAKKEWLTPQAAAAEFGITTRHLRNLEEYGIPCRGERSSKRYLWSDCYDWWVIYQMRAKTASRGHVGYLDPAEAVRERRRLAATERAWWRLTHPEWYVNSPALDDEAQAMLPAVRSIIAGGGRPDMLPL